MTDWPNAYQRKTCADCGHGEAMHDIRRNGTRGSCSISIGFKATPCGCKAYREEGGA